MRSGSLSVQTTWWPSSAKHVPVTKPSYPQPITEIRTFCLLNCSPPNGTLCCALSTRGTAPANILRREQVALYQHLYQQWYAKYSRPADQAIGYIPYRG